jgi:hypothetical protein
MLAGRESCVGYVTYPHAAKLYDGVTDRIEHSPNLLVLAFTKDYFVPVIAGLLCAVDQADLGGRSVGLPNRNPSPEAFDLGFSR